MSDNNLKSLAIMDLLRLHDSILDELTIREVIRTHNLVGDYAEWLVKEKLDLELSNCSKTGYDAISKSNERYQIKARQNHPSNQSREFSVVRNFDNNTFDFLIAIIFNKDFTVKESYKLSHDTIPKYANYNKYQNGYRPVLKRSIVNDADVENITDIFYINK